MDSISCLPPSWIQKAGNTTFGINSNITTSSVSNTAPTRNRYLPSTVKNRAKQQISATYIPVFFVRPISSTISMKAIMIEGRLKQTPRVLAISTQINANHIKNGTKTESLTRLIENIGITGNSAKNNILVKQIRHLAPKRRQYTITVVKEVVDSTAKVTEHKNNPRSTEPTNFPSSAKIPKKSVSNTGWWSDQWLPSVNVLGKPNHCMSCCPVSYQMIPGYVSNR